MKLHYLQHVPFEGLGFIQDWALSRHVDISCTKLFKGEQLPESVDADLLVIVGGPMGVNDENEYSWLREEKAFLKRAISSQIKILGICLGAQLLAEVLGANVFANTDKEIGWFPIKAVQTSSAHPIGKILANAGEVFHWHGDTFSLPERALHLSASDCCQNQAFVVGDRILALQFHLETTPQSAKALIENCGHEITKGRFVQTSDEILRDYYRFKRINKVMETCLDCFTGMSAST